MGNGNMPGVIQPWVTLGAAVLAGTPRTLSLSAGQTTWAFAANTFFINDIGVGGSGVTTVRDLHG